MAHVTWSTIPAQILRLCAVIDLHAYLTRTSDSGIVKPKPIDLTTVISMRRALNFLKIVEPPLVEDAINGSKTRAAFAHRPFATTRPAFANVENGRLLQQNIS
jgi:hypothetical protein